MFLPFVVVLLISLTEGSMTCTTPYAYYNDFTGFSTYGIVCCVNSGNGGGYACANPDAGDYFVYCNSIFDTGSSSPCNCGASCFGQVLELSPPGNGSCSGACTCSGNCCFGTIPCAPTSAPTSAPTTKAPTKAPTTAPTSAPTKAPTKAPTNAPTNAPTKAPTKAPTNAPTEAPTKAPTEAPTQVPLGTPTSEPTEAPTEAPSKAPTSEPTIEPTSAPTQQGNKGMPLAMSLIFVPIGVIILVGGIYLLYQSSVTPSVKYSRT